MIKVILEGIACGLILSLMLGPVFFGLLHTSIHKGFSKALIYASGVAFSDAFFIVITYFGIAGFMDDPSFRKVLMVIGGLIMITFGLYYIFKKASDTIELKPDKKVINKKNIWLKGFLLNAINPSVFIFWIGIVSYTGITYQNDRLFIFLFFSSCILTVFGTDALKAYIANKIKIFFTNRILNKMNKVLGIAILTWGVYFVYDIVMNT